MRSNPLSPFANAREYRTTGSEDLHFAAREVVLRQLHYLLKKAGAFVVVEIFGRQILGFAESPVRTSLANWESSVVGI